MDKLVARAGNFVKHGKWDKARETYRKIVAKNPADMESWLGFAAVNGMLGRFADAETCCRKALDINPRLPAAWMNLGSALDQQGKFAEAERAFRTLVDMQPSAAALQSLANAQRKLHKGWEAVSTLKQALALAPNNIDLHIDMGHAWKACGDAGQAVASFRQATWMAPDNQDARANLIGCMLYDAHTTPAELFAEQSRWGKALESRFPDGDDLPNDRAADRRLRIGYCSPDLRDHSVAYFFEPVLATHDREAFEIYCYADVARPDATTRRLRTLDCHWRDTHGKSHDEMLRMIRADRIDILVDLAGLTVDHRLEVFARHAAPVQVNYLGYPSSTGLTAMQYRLTDTWADPPGDADTLHTEELIRLPGGFLCYRAGGSCPEVARLPAADTGYVTFGSFNNLTKVTPEVIATWAAILERVPDARLVCKSAQLGDAEVRGHYAGMFGEHGVAADRIELIGTLESHAEHMALYGRIDIGLDTFPYNGTTTTCEALWMGVPVVTLAGDRHAARVGISLLNQVGLEDWIASSRDAYITTAARAAGAPESLAELRGGLRERVRNSRLCDGPGLTRDIEAVYREAWRNWCGRTA